MLRKNWTILGDIKKQHQAAKTTQRLTMALEAMTRHSLEQFCIILREVMPDVPADLEAQLWRKIKYNEKVSAGENPNFGTVCAPCSSILKHLKYPLPFMPTVVRYEGCMAIKYNCGLFTPCGGKVKEDDMCGRCAKAGAKYGKLDDREAEFGKFVGSDGKKEVVYAQYLKKKGLSYERDVKPAMRSLGISLNVPEEHLTLPEAAPKSKRGRGKKAAVLVADSDGDVSKDSSDDSDDSDDESMGSMSEKKAAAEAEKAAKKAAAEAEKVKEDAEKDSDSSDEDSDDESLGSMSEKKEAKKAAAEAEKAEKAAKKEAEAAEKKASADAEKVEKAAKKEAEAAEKKAAAEAEKAEKAAKKEAEAAEKKAKKEAEEAAKKAAAEAEKEAEAERKAAKKVKKAAKEAAEKAEEPSSPKELKAEEFEPEFKEEDGYEEGEIDDEEMLASEKTGWVFKLDKKTYVGKLNADGDLIKK